MQRLARKGGDPRAQLATSRGEPPAAVAVDGVADHWVAALREVNPDLVRPPGCEPAFDLRRAATEIALDAIAGEGRLAVPGADHRHLFPIARAAADIALDLARRRHRH